MLWGGMTCSTYNRNTTEITTAIGKNWPEKKRMREINRAITVTVTKNCRSRFLNGRLGASQVATVISGTGLYIPGATRERSGRFYRVPAVRDETPGRLLAKSPPSPVG